MKVKVPFQREGGGWLPSWSWDWNGEDAMKFILIANYPIDAYIKSLTTKNMFVMHKFSICKIFDILHTIKVVLFSSLFFVNHITKIWNLLDGKHLIRSCVLTTGQDSRKAMCSSSPTCWCVKETLMTKSIMKWKVITSFEWNSIEHRCCYTIRKWACIVEHLILNVRVHRIMACYIHRTHT